MNILSIKVYCYSEDMAFQDDMPGTPIEPGKAYEVGEDELIPEFDLGKAVINTMDINPEHWRTTQAIFVNDTPALLVDYDGREFYAPYTKEEFRELLKTKDKNASYMRKYYISQGIEQVLLEFESKYGTSNDVTIDVRRMYVEQLEELSKMKK